MVIKELMQERKTWREARSPLDEDDEAIERTVFEKNKLVLAEIVILCARASIVLCTHLCTYTSFVCVCLFVVSHSQPLLSTFGRLQTV